MNMIELIFFFLNTVPGSLPAQKKRRQMSTLQIITPAHWQFIRSQYCAILTWVVFQNAEVRVNSAFFSLRTLKEYHGVYDLSTVFYYIFILFWSQLFTWKRGEALLAAPPAAAIFLKYFLFIIIMHLHCSVKYNYSSEIIYLLYQLYSFASSFLKIFFSYTYFLYFETYFFLWSNTWFFCALFRKSIIRRKILWHF